MSTLYGCEVLVRSLLLADADVSALTNGRIYPILRPQTAALPAITYQRITTTRVDPLEAAVPLADARLQLDCWATSYATAKELATKVRRALAGQSYPDGPSPTLAAIRPLENDRDDFETDTKIYRVSQDYSVWWRED